MSFDKKREEFEKELNSQLAQAFFIGNQLSEKARIRKNTIVIKGRKFKASLNELKSLLNSESEDLLATIFETATQVLQNSSEENIGVLRARVNYLEQSLNMDKQLNLVVAGYKVATRSIYTVAGVATAVLGYECILTALGAGFLTLAMGPLGIAALGVGLVIVGSILTCIAAKELSDNYRFCKGSQLKEINEFINTVAPPVTNEVDTRSEILPVQESLYPSNF